jgi:hypothetical protein
VADVNINNALLAGVIIGAPTANQPGATGSGPYSNLNISCPGPVSACSNQICIQIQAQTRGVHGITCVATSNPNTLPLGAIYLDASNNTIEDVHVEGFNDAIVVGDLNVPVSGNTILNVTGAYGKGPVREVVHICKPGMQTGACSTSNGQVTDLTLKGIRSVGSGTPPSLSAVTIQDDVTGTAINSSTGIGYVGLYVLGEALLNGGNSPVGYSRFTTSPVNNSAGGVPTWGSGASPANSSACNTGVVYSNTNGSSNSTIFVCSKWVWKYLVNM